MPFLEDVDKATVLVGNLVDDFKRDEEEKCYDNERDSKGFGGSRGPPPPGDGMFCIVQRGLPMSHLAIVEVRVVLYLN
jgi:hypothetical protein